MRDWQLNADSPLSMRFAADPRLGRTDYTDDQSWEITFGGPEEPAIAFQTRYGGRAGLARVVPMWVFDGRSVYEGMGFAERPTLRSFAPNYARITARPINTLSTVIELWVMASQAVGGRFILENTADQPLTFRLELYGQVAREGKPLEMNLLGLDDGSEALHLGRVANLNPILLMEPSAPQAGAGQYGDSTSGKLTAPITIQPRQRAIVRWIHAGQSGLRDSLQTAYYWLKRADWEAELGRIEQANARTPTIETGNAEWDAVLAFSAQVALRSFIGPTGSLPNASFVSARIPARGFSPRGDGSDHGWQWNGQTAATGLLLLPSAATLAPDLALGAFRNWLAVRQGDGWIDFKPGLVGQRARMLSAPLLATLAWRLYEQTEDHAFIGEALPSLRAFFARWFAADCDQDADGLPEWANTSQNGYAENPTFARFRRWAQNADISKAETPDMAAYLTSEGRCLLKMAELTGDQTDVELIKERLAKLEAHLDGMWNEAAGTYHYRDRDTDRVAKGVNLFRGKGDDAFDVRTPLDPPNRLILRIIGGKETAPRVSVIIEGMDAGSSPIAETIPANAFAWYYGMGAAVSEHVYTQVNYIKFEGLIRLYSVEIDTVDLTRADLTQLLPLWAGVPNADRAARIVQTLTDPARYWRPFGLPICPVDDPAFVANNDGGSGGVWLQWNVMLLEGLLRYGHVQEAQALFTRLMAAQVKALRRDHGFRGGYNSETGDGLGDIDELEGVLPLDVFMQFAGVHVLDSRRVRAGGAFALPDPVRVTQFGVEVTRRADGTTVRFPSGQVVEVDAALHMIEDPAPLPAEPVTPDEALATEPEPASAPQSPSPGPLPPTPADEAVIPVITRKDDTMEIPISKIDYTPSASASDAPPATSDPKPSAEADAPGDSGTPPAGERTIRIPIRHSPKDD
jgi:hypothetical protein